MDQEKSGINNLIIYAVIAIAVVILAWYIISSVTGKTNVSVRLDATNLQKQTYPYETTVFKIYVNNTGTVPITNMTLDFFLNNAQQNSFTVSLPAKTGAVLNASYTYQTGGSYDFDAVADPAHLLKFANSSGAQSNVSITVSNASLPTVYNSIPNNNVTSTQSFYMLQDGVDLALFANSKYNVSLFNELLGPKQNVINTTLAVITPYIYDVNGAYIQYRNSSTAYSMWIQGSIVPAYIYEIVGSFGLHQTNSTINGTALTSVNLGNSTSLCYLFSGGWTKILEYQNSTGSSQTCTSILAQNYPSNQSANFVTALKADPNMGVYQSRFIYTNSTRIGTALIQNNNSLGSFNLFENDYGFFGSYIHRNNPPFNLTGAPMDCLGIAYSSNNINVCSTYVVPAAGGINFTFGMINSTMITSNYTISLFSLVNSTLVLGAHGSAAALIGSLGTNAISAKWTSPFKNACSFYNMSSSLPCNVVAYAQSTNIASLNITNRLNQPITLNDISCYLPGDQLYYVLNQTLNVGQSLQFNTTCNAITIPGFSYQTSYNLWMNYTYGTNHTVQVNGILNASNLGTI